MINLGGFPAGSVEAIPNGGQQQFFYQGTVQRDDDGTLAYLGGSWDIQTPGGTGFTPVTLTGSPSTTPGNANTDRIKLAASGLTGWSTYTFLMLAGPVIGAIDAAARRNFSAIRWFPVSELLGLTAVSIDDWANSRTGQVYSAATGGTFRGRNTSILFSNGLPEQADQNSIEIAIARTSTNELLIGVEHNWAGVNIVFQGWGV